MLGEPREDDRDPLLGRVLDGRYRIEAAIGSGGIGTVYRAVHLTLSRPVAIKVLRPEFSRQDEFLARFDREARALSRLAHVNVVTVTDFGVAHGFPYLVMELLDGHSLEDEIDRGGITLPRAVAIGRQVLSTLVYAHSQGVVNRDLKPQNIILIDQPGMHDLVKILDFGLAKIVGAGEDEAARSITKHGAIFGTPAYMSPEQAEGHPADVRSDLYSAGVLLYEMFAGRPPFVTEHTADLLRHHIVTRPPRMAEVARVGAEIPEMFERVVARALQKERGARYQTAEGMLAAFDEAAGVAGLSRGDARTTGPRLPAPQRISGIARTIPATPSGSLPSSAPRHQRTIAVGAAAAFVVAAVAVALGGAFGSSAPDPPPVVVRAVPAQPAPRAPRGPKAPAKAPALPRRPAGRDPWRSPGAPVELRAVLAQIDAGAYEDAERDTRAWVKDHRSEALGHLVLGHGYCARGWRRDCLRRYRMALRFDESVRGDPRMLAEIVTALGDSRVAGDATEMLRVVFGAEAVPALVEATTGARSAEIGHAAAELLGELGQGAEVDAVGMSLADLTRTRRCEDLQAALAALRAVHDPRIRPSLETLRTNLDVRECLGDQLEEAIAQQR